MDTCAARRTAATVMRSSASARRSHAANTRSRALRWIASVMREPP